MKRLLMIVLMVFLAAILLNGCDGGGNPTESKVSIVGTWHNSNSGWRLTFNADGSYSAKLYGSSYNITEIGSYEVRGELLRIRATQYNSGTQCASGCAANYEFRIVSLTESTLILESTYNRYQSTYRRV